MQNTFIAVSVVLLLILIGVLLHTKKENDVPSGTVIPIPMHGKYVQEAYIKELKDLFAEIEARGKEAE